MGSRKHNPIGWRFGRLIVTGEAGTIDRARRVAVLCDCGTRKVVRFADLRRGDTSSCGCIGKPGPVKHGLHGTPGYTTWMGIHRRCRNPGEPGYRNYGGRGIKVCDRWSEFATFIADMGPPPPGTSLDRIDNDGDYEPGNCRWATRAVQNQNKRTNVWIDTPEGRISIADAAARAGLSRVTLAWRVRAGWTGEDLFRPPSWRKHATPQSALHETQPPPPS